MYRIADINIEIKSECNYFKGFSEEYIVKEGKADISLTCTNEDLIAEAKNSEVAYKGFYIENIAISRKLAEYLPMFQAIVFHSAAFDVDGVGVAFAAHSGTGKTTHMNLWQKYLGDRMVIVNGDKPIVRFFADQPNQPYAYGTPWNGKEGFGCNMRTPLKHICFIERSATNYVQKIEKKEAIDRIFNQVYMPSSPMAVINAMSLIERLMSCCDLWVIHCNMEQEAAEIAYKTIFGEITE